MNRLIITLACLLLLASCVKDKKITNAEPTLTLNELEVVPDGVHLSWSINVGTQFPYYTVYRKIHPDSAEVIVAVVSEMTCVDTTVPLSPYVSYRVSLNTLYSNSREYLRPEIKLFNYDPFEVLYDSESDQLYIFEKTGAIAKYDVQNGTMVKVISTNATLGYPALNKSNGQTEIYVPRNDGWIFIYDANLEKKGQINTGGELRSVIHHNDVLIIGYQPNVWSSHFTKVYHLNTGQSDTLVIGNWSEKLLKLPGTNLNVIALANGFSSYSMMHFRFNANGGLISHNINTNTGYPTDARLVQEFTDGKRFITSSSGIVYDSSLTYVSSLPVGNMKFTGFGFNGTANTIYAGCDDKSLRTYSATDYQLTSTQGTKAYPFKIFYDNGTIIVAGKTILIDPNDSYYGPAPKLLIEKY